MLKHATAHMHQHCKQLQKKTTMKKLTILTILITLLISCSSIEKSPFGEPNIDIKTINTDFSLWWKYHSDNIVLSSNFIPIDDSSKIMNIEQFFKDLETGDYIPIKLDSKNSTTYYQLFKLGNNADEDIRNTIKNTSQIVYKHHLREGKMFPKFSFKDLDGNEYNNENTKGKIVILKCWFIKCGACIAEFPELNEMVENYKNRNDIIFLSLAFDTEAELKNFLVKKPFDYKVASVKKDFFESELKISAYPTHFIIDKDGIIEKVVNTSDELFLELSDKGILNLNEKSSHSIPPPPALPN